MGAAKRPLNALPTTVLAPPQENPALNGLVMLFKVTSEESYTSEALSANHASAPAVVSVTETSNGAPGATAFVPFTGLDMLSVIVGPVPLAAVVRAPSWTCATTAATMAMRTSDETNERTKRLERSTAPPFRRTAPGVFARHRARVADDGTAISASATWRVRSTTLDDVDRHGD